MFWHEVCHPSQRAFFEPPSRLTAIQAAWPTRHVHDWLWRERHRDKVVDPEIQKKRIAKFQKKLIAKCPQLAWLRDVTDASKHCGLHRKVKLDKVSGTGLRTTGEISDPFGTSTHTHSDPLLLEVDGVTHNFADVLEVAIQYWETHYFR